MTVSGPMWLGDYSDQDMCKDVIIIAEDSITSWDGRLTGLLAMIRDEIGFPPTFFDVDEITARLKLPSKSPSYVVEKLRENGFKATLTHFKDRGIKTDANIEDLFSVIKSTF